MPTQVLSAQADLYAAIKAAIVGSGFTYQEVSASIIRMDFSGDASFVGVDNSILIEVGTSSGRFRWRGCVQPSTTATFTAAKSLTNPADGTDYYTEWRDMGAIGDTVAYSNVPNLVAFAPVKVSQTYATEMFLFMKKASPYDSGVRFYYMGAYMRRLYSDWTIRSISPNILTHYGKSQAYRTITGDGLTFGTVIYQSSNSMAVEYTEDIVAWRGDLTLLGGTFTINGKTYFYAGYGFWTGEDQTNVGTSPSTVPQPTNPANAWACAFRMDP